ncbi:SPOR domain-containing protein [uncultured Maribacter sp.]|jgi:cell division protein FtsN|uniref:SPOR domain-containing protein n=1 Tax=uncultured Maribacter sp. TaxID=431308 RepID=UPI00262668C3|nr:SPOR domain-containing protein [uncultured Maribacter sp.]
MKILSTIVVFTCFAHFSYAQGANVNIEQNPKIDQLLEIYKSSLSNNEYYRIQVGFGNYAKAQKIKANVEEDFPDLSSKIDFDSPTYRVRVGRFTSKLDAERKFNEVRIKYPDAMLLKPKKSTK